MKTTIKEFLLKNIKYTKYIIFIIIMSIVYWTLAYQESIKIDNLKIELLEAKKLSVIEKKVQDIKEAKNESKKYYNQELTFAKKQEEAKSKKEISIWLGRCLEKQLV